MDHPQLIRNSTTTLSDATLSSSSLCKLQCCPRPSGALIVRSTKRFATSNAHAEKYRPSIIGVFLSLICCRRIFYLRRVYLRRGELVDRVHVANSAGRLLFFRSGSQELWSCIETALQHLTGLS